MNLNRPLSPKFGTLSAVSAAAILLAACGGGGDDSAAAPAPSASAPDPAASAPVVANVKPTVTLTAPALTQSEAPASLTLKATAADSDGTVSKVEFFDGATLLGQGVLNAGTYELSVPQTAGKTFSITAKATDNSGDSTTTAAQAITLDPNPVTMWANLSTKQRAGYTKTPDEAMKAGADLATQFLTVLGQTTVLPKLPPAMSHALASLGQHTPATVGDHACPQGGNLKVLQDGANLRYHYQACKISGFTYNGGNDVTFTYPHLDTVATPDVLRDIPVAVTRVATADGFELEVTGLQVTGNGTPGTGAEDFPWNAFGPSRLTCTGTGAAQKCLSNYDINFMWGTDLAWTGYTDTGANGLSVDDPYTLSGTYRNAHCARTVDGPGAEGPEVCLLPGRVPASLHIRFDKLTLDAGRAIVYANDGYAVITRESAPTTGQGGLVGQLRTVQKEVLKIVRTVGAADPVTEIFDCSFNPESGDWGTYNAAGGCVKR